MKSTPVPMIVDISSDLGSLVVNDLFTDEELLVSSTVIRFVCSLTLGVVDLICIDCIPNL